MQPKELRKIGNCAFKIVWEDGKVSEYPFQLLRQNCQCAHCIDEWTGKLILKKEDVPEDLQGLKVQIVGQYAIRIDFSDGHNTGLYTFDALRKLQ